MKSRDTSRVLWCIRCLGFGGAERLLVSAAQVRDRDRFHYEAAYVLPGYSALAPELEAAGVPVHCLGSTGADFDLRWTLRLRRLLLERRYDIVHFHLPYAAAVGRLVARSVPAAVRPMTVTTEHNVWRTNHLLVRWANSLTMPLDDARIAVNAAVRDALPRRHRGATQLVPHGVPVGELAALQSSRAEVRAELGIGAHEVLIGTVANLRAGKGYDVLLPVARRLLDRGVPVRFAAVGGGPLDEEVRALHERLHLGDRFLLLGSRADAVRVVSGYDVFVLPSLFEGFPVSVMEALAVGVPVVATSVGGIPDMVTDGVEGLLVPPGRPDELHEALLTAVTDSDRRARMAAAARARAPQFDIATAVRRVEAIYAHVLAGVGPTDDRGPACAG